MSVLASSLNKPICVCGGGQCVPVRIVVVAGEVTVKSDVMDC